MTPMMELIGELKQADQDFEFYPTTNEIIARVVRDISRRDRGYGRGLESVLDIGAGNGKVLDAIKAGCPELKSFYAIEKSPILCGELGAHVFIVGTAFEEQSLLAKSVDVIFCNPPYSEFEAWACKIIRETCAKIIYLVIPQRWKDSLEITQALKYREASARSMGDFDFERADRRARAKVELLRIELDEKEDEVFQRFFDEQFADLKAKFAHDKHADQKKTEETRGQRFGKLVAGDGYVGSLVALFNLEMANIQRNYKLVSELDADLLREFEIHPARIMGCLKARLSDLRMVYWRELFSRMRPITDRLTNASRNSLLDTLGRNMHVDFTVSNIHAVLVWAIKNANRYIDSQLIAVYEMMVETANVLLYKSNHKKFVERRWRYEDTPENTHYKLDLRIVMHRAGGLNTSVYSYDKHKANGLEESAFFFMRDLLTVAANLGFSTSTQPFELQHGAFQWEGGKPREFTYTDKKGKTETLFEVRAFKNRNLHLRLGKAFALALNVEHGRLRGWLRTKEEAAEELQEPDAPQFFRSNHKLLSGPNFPLLA